MLKITKAERFELEEKYGLRMGQHIHRTYSKPKHYFMTEDSRSMKALNEIRNK